MPIIKEIKKHKLVLDTHVFIWSVTKHPCLTKKYWEGLQTALDSRSVYLSPISAWEVGMLVEKGRLELDRDALDWMERALETPGIALAPLSPAIAIRSSRLQGTFHGDPADRMLVATAIEHSATLVTCDKKILAYGKGKNLSVFNPSR